MKRAIVFVTAGALAVAVASTAACNKDNDANGDGIDAAVPLVASRVARGHYLVDHVFVCSGCHSPRVLGMIDPARYLAGEECMYGSPIVTADGGSAGADAGDGGDARAPDAAARDGSAPDGSARDGSAPEAQVGCLNSRNLTNDATGLRNFTDAEIKDMILNGVRPNGELLDPVMPYWEFHAMTDEDADAVVAYLRTVPGRDHRDKPSEAPWYPTSVAARPLDVAKVFAPLPTAPNYDALMRGRYLATLACVGCHTPDAYPRGARATAPLPIDESRLFAGNGVFAASLYHFPTFIFPPMIYGQNLTQDPTGLAGYQVDDIVKGLKLGKAKDGSNVCPPMPSGKEGFAGLTDGDAHDVAEYILSLPGITNKRPEDCKL